MKKIKEIVLATGNQHKVAEIMKIMADLKSVKFISLKEFPKIIIPEETGQTLRENALIKAMHVARETKQWTLADDTGLEVDALNGKPGVYSARYAGETATYEDNNKKLLKELSEISQKKRTAKFKTISCLCSPDGLAFFEEGILEGEISLSPKGDNGFGYDPIFIVKDSNKTLAELTDTEKNALSHRARAFQNIKKYIN
ncbi:MAG: RdgB/HAM1 family non-canonical purine NTP pyrophosphatase [Elusimicrobiaceae bacterium]|jgi:XTP/dITP diphosphohydrolase|nr:RdgB/HAM1 family non-canonical purine NTP pyrophosphatase [Elusimicrobiaceae bacterium]MBT3955320.1 RdgB/HAM1 family non-canonical purine NTP pyrophosphatase [Elusimicrobiaceae bacterium]MBT4008456.1 RdgB/HAM1 family non-canonical purine NTP pyrophosphatase [Elusimicrobiaceae bacterium]MBT4403265.1 RdgB/HAM1 family non-canonical purine NTP pyrophosphatase [Elusimicrobiaceae bacterium]MBT4440185.1 RdgB/HAM1 family non-canonical purine NTP pyrophosphatase [Elusimicrobiaceae bacterium]